VGRNRSSLWGRCATLRFTHRILTILKTQDARALGGSFEGLDSSVRSQRTVRRTRRRGTARHGSRNDTAAAEVQGDLRRDLFTARSRRGSVDPDSVSRQAGDQIASRLQTLMNTRRATAWCPACRAARECPGDGSVAVEAEQFHGLPLHWRATVQVRLGRSSAHNTSSSWCSRRPAPRGVVSGTVAGAVHDEPAIGLR